MNNFKKLSLAGILAAGLTFVGCLGEDTAPVPDVKLKISTKVDAVNTSSGLSKSSAISYSKLIVVLTSNATVPDTVRDTILVGQNGFTATATSAQTINKTYTVKGLRTWTVAATVRDSKDSVTHTGSAVTPSFVKVADTASVAFSLTSRFSMYEVNFATLPTQITTQSGTGHTQTITIKRLRVAIGSIVVKDTTAPVSFTGAQQFTYDYVPVGSYQVRLTAFGTTGQTWNDTLFSGVTTINTAAGTDETVALNLDWKGPNTGTEKIAVTIGKVGKTTVNGGTYCGVGGCVPKK